MSWVELRWNETTIQNETKWNGMEWCRIEARVTAKVWAWANTVGVRSFLYSFIKCSNSRCCFSGWSSSSSSSYSHSLFHSILPIVSCSHTNASFSSASFFSGLSISFTWDCLFISMAQSYHTTNGAAFAKLNIPFYFSFEKTFLSPLFPFSRPLISFRHPFLRFLCTAFVPGHTNYNIDRCLCTYGVYRHK